jgi:hypothetical protein
MAIPNTNERWGKFNFCLGSSFPTSRNCPAMAGAFRRCPGLPAISELDAALLVQMSEDEYCSGCITRTAITLAATVSQALDYIQTQTFDLVLDDLIHRECDEYELIRRCRGQSAMRHHYSDRISEPAKRIRRNSSRR